MTRSFVNGWFDSYRRKENSKNFLFLKVIDYPLSISKIMFICVFSDSLDYIVVFLENCFYY